MKILIAGLGSIGRRHLRNLLALSATEDIAKPEIVLYRTHRSTLPDDDLAGLVVETDLQAALAHQPDAVIVSNPTSLHLDVAIPAARAGCHILLEKPVSHNFERLVEFRNAVDQNGVKVLVGYQFRFHPALKQIAALLAKNAVGQPLSVRAHWGEYLPGWHPWEDYRQSYSARAELGGGVILTLSHPLDYLRWLFGEVEAVWAFTSKPGDRQSGLELNVEDNAEIGLRFKSNVLGAVHLDYNQRPPTHRLEIIGSQGTLRWDNSEQSHGNVYWYSTQSGPADAGSSVANVPWEILPPPVAKPEFERNQLFIDEMRHFMGIIGGSAIDKAAEQPLCSLEDGIQALRLALAALQSAQQGTLVRISQPLQAEVLSALAGVQALVLDFDGVLTDNRVLVHQDGSEAVLADRSDGMGIGRLKGYGLPILVLSTETNPVVQARATKLGIACLQGIQDKAAALRQWLAATTTPDGQLLDPARVVYVGNDINDLACMEMVGFPIAVADAYPAVKQKASLILQNSGGKGAIREICDLILMRREYDR